jgi:N-carbamoylputrescine amidase
VSIRVLRAERLASPARRQSPSRGPVRIGAVQERWHGDAESQQAAIADGIRVAATEGARLVCTQELTLSSYFAVEPDGQHVEPEPIPDGRTSRFAIALARETGVYVQASLFERAESPGPGYDTAIVASPEGEIVLRTRKVHIPGGAGYHEDHYFKPGAAPSAEDVMEIDGGQFAFPTCYDQWFPELARAYSLRGAEVLVYPSAIGSEPELPNFDTEAQWERVISANGIMNGTFMVAVNRIGSEGPVTFYGSSFISDPYGRKLVQAPREEPAVLIADLDLEQRRDWLDVFPFFRGRRPEAYRDLV